MRLAHSSSLVRSLSLVTLVAAAVPACLDEQGLGESESNLRCTDCEPPPPDEGGGGGGGGGGSGVSQPSNITETMIDRCSNDVMISRTFDAAFSTTMEGLGLRRPDAESYSEWSTLMPVTGSSYIRWWCHSTTGNLFDPGTWRIGNDQAAKECTGNWYDPTTTLCVIKHQLGTSAVDGWTPERSRCNSSGTKAVQARLGPDRLLEIRCLE
ncbi:MAG TPA: hypothetical protein VIV40_06675 [Kofleriaceae bacterium]